MEEYNGKPVYENDLTLQNLQKRLDRDRWSNVTPVRILRRQYSRSRSFHSGERQTYYQREWAVKSPAGFWYTFHQLSDSKVARSWTGDTEKEWQDKIEFNMIVIEESK